MKRLISVLALAALLGQAALVIAQESGDPSVKSVLDAARSKYWKDRGGDSTTNSETDSASDQDSVPYAPMILGFVPGLSIPFGYFDASMAAGAIGILARDINGIEASGVFNLSRDIRGFQAAGVFNLARSVVGFQSAGTFNIVDKDLLGFQSAGIFNIVNGHVSGFQAAGIFNLDGKVDAPVQAAGIFNVVDEIRGFQAAGIFNIAQTVEGGQAAGIFNAAKRVQGVQIGLVNVTDHIDGVQLGLVNIAGNGVGSLGVTYEPSTNFFYAHIQEGTPALYTVAGLGAAAGDWGTNISGFVASLGLGSRTRLFGLNIDLDVSASQPLAGMPMDREAWRTCDSSLQDRFRPYPSIRLMAGLPVGERLQIVAGLAADIDMDSLGSRVPEALKTANVWNGSAFGEGFSAYYKWFFGIKI